ncbi:hypothetical protein TSAR_011783 [Trichomalopsis sarcophagae]|uniref:Uncharacterized protein n=1 Tax=Trichomalopsis sarcophagae TaxID=543379 RepID=A0A232F7U7_9HYME|nr:hypothetical protein TSAR_011783 [Trichomalopsis sarcophagae]
MQFSQKKVCLTLAFFLVAVSSASAKSLQKREANQLESYDDFLNAIDNLRNIPFVGSVIAPYAAVAKGIIQNLDNAVDGNIGNIVDSIMPCKFNGPFARCEGKFDTASARKIAKKLLGLIPLDSMPDSVSSVIRLATNMI